MAGQVSILDESFVVNTGLTNGITKYQAVVSDTTDNGITLATAAGQGKFLGIAQEAKGAGLTANVRMLGVSFAIASAAITAGDDVILAAANGQVSTAVGATGTPVIIGKALTHASAAGDLIKLYVKP